MGVEQILHVLTEKHNALLARSIVDLRDKYTRTNIMYFDVNTLYDDVFNHAAKYGFTNTIDSCTGNILDMQLATSMFMMSVNMPACAGYMFFDPIHPTTKTHQLLAKHLATFIEGQGVFIKTTSRPLIAHT